MIISGGLRLVDEDEPSATPPGGSSPETSSELEDPKVFVRTLTVPPGWPWEQARTADLDARHGSPLPAAEVIYQVKRLTGWSPGRPGRFAAFYVLAKDVGERLETHARVDGQDVGVVFEAPTLAEGRLRRLGLVGLAAGVMAFLLVLSAGVALGRRAELESQLAIAEQKAASKLKAASDKARLKAQAQALRYRADRGAPLSEVLADMAWISSAKSPDTHIEAFHWDRGYLAVEARGDVAPIEMLSGETLERSAKPIRPGVWLWGVERRALSTPVETPVAALPREGGQP
jgi:hypothetical protein